MYETLIDYNGSNDAPLPNENIRYALHKVFDEEASDSHNVTADTFSQTSNTQIDNSNAILKNEKLDKVDALAETLKQLTINNTGYYTS